MLFISIGSFVSYLAGRLIKAIQHENALRALFEQTLVGTGDGVISTDGQKLVRVLNPTAEPLTGWSRSRLNNPYKIFLYGLALDPFRKLLSEATTSILWLKPGWLMPAVMIGK